MEMSFIQQLHDATPGPSDVLWIEGDLKRFDTYNYFGHSPEHMLRFLATYM
jgi:hypothetical protein